MHPECIIISPNRVQNTSAEYPHGR